MAADPLPKFDNPPVNEVVLGVQFDPLTRLTPAHLGIWWAEDDRRARYPLCEERPPLPTAVETFAAPGIPSFRLQVGPMSPALWFLSQTRNELLQVQRDRFTRNWTRSPDVRYPSYDALRPAFEQDLAEFSDFVVRNELGEIAVRQAELTYINPIRMEGVWTHHGELERWLALWSGRVSEGFLPEPEDVGLVTRYVMARDGVPVGRLIANVQPAWEGTNPVCLFTLTARGAPREPTLDAALEFLDLGHEWVVRGFTTLTTEMMHNVWERRQ